MMGRGARLAQATEGKAGKLDKKSVRRGWKKREKQKTGEEADSKN